MQKQTLIIIKDIHQLPTAWQTADTLAENGNTVSVLVVLDGCSDQASVLSDDLRCVDRQNVAWYTLCPNGVEMPDLRYASLETIADMLKAADFVMSF